MPQYLRIAENIYKRFHRENKFSAPLQECLISIVEVLREELKDTDLRLIYSHINFVRGLQKEPPSGQLNVFLSLVPNPDNKDQFVMWLSNLIENVTEGGVKRMPPKLEAIPHDVNFDSEVLKSLQHRSKPKSSRDIAAYFKSQECQSYS